MTASDNDRERHLLAEGTALRRLARSLSGHHADADDLVQDTFAASLTSRCDDAGKRPWLFGTLRNLALLWRRASARRTAREQVAAAAARPAGGDPAAIALQAEAMRNVAAAVHALEEPFRTVIVLRFWRGLLPEAIAQELGVPRNTVRSRLQRGLERLRERLDHTYGDRRGWLAALLPFGRPGDLVAAAAAPAAGATTVATTFGTLLMTKLHVAMTTGALAAVGILLWWLAQGATPPPPETLDDRSRVAAQQAPPAAAADADTATVAADATERTARAPAESAPGLTVHGHVTRAGAPQEGLALTLQWFEGTEALGQPASAHEVLSDAEGRFVWRGPLRTTVGLLRAVRSGPVQVARIQCTPQFVQPGQAEVALTVTVIALDRTLTGRVHDVGGAPIAGAELSINGWADVATHSDADGRYELRVTGPPYPLLVAKTGYRERLLDSYIPDGKQRHELDIELEPGATLTGRVVDEAGQPVADAKVSASGLTSRTVTDAAGQFAFGGAEQDENHGLTVTKAGFQPSTTTARAGGTPVEIVLRPGLALTVRVLGEDGKGLAGARIGVMHERFRPMENRGFTDAEGRVRLVDLPAKTIEVFADKTGFVKARGEADVPNHRGDFVLVLRAGRTIAGRVVDAAGAPIVGASVYGQITPADKAPQTVGSRATSDVEGRFTIQELPPEPCHVMAHHADFRRASLPGIGGSPTDLVVRMEKAASVAGRVVDGITGAPVAAFTVVLTADHAVHPLQYVDPVRFADSDGYWRIKHWQLQPGAPLFAEVWAAGYAPQRVTSVAQADAPRDQNVIRLFAGTTVTGVVTDAATSAPIAQVEVVLQSGDPEDTSRRAYLTPSQEGPHKTRVHTDADGRFELLAVPPGENRLVLAHVDYPKRTFGPFQVTAGVPTLEVQPQLAHGVTLRGRVTGVPDLAGKNLAVHIFDAKTIDTVLGADGSFEVRGVGPGRASLSFTVAKGLWYTLRVEVGDKDLTDLVFAVPAAGTGSVRATVVGLPRGRGSVASLGMAKGQCAIVRTFEYADAAFVVEALPPGRYEVEAFSLDGAVGRTEVTVGSGEVAVTVDIVRR